ncbi:ribonuclease Z [Halobacteriales archaeon QH_10_67_22]|nr:MAG: ribonuclease Z [Halobacteriales archaeon QH_10_67_22]
MRVTFLGTGGAVPTTQRNTSALAIRREGERFLFDCGEGTQRQMMRFDTGFGVDHVFVTHCHGDHVLGLPGLVQTMDFNGRDDPLAVHAPGGTRSAVADLLSVASTDPAFPVRVTQNAPGDTVLGIPPGPKYSKLHAGEPVEHDGRTIEPGEVVGPPRPGRRVVYTGDTRPTEAVVAAADGADLLVHDATFADDWADRARETGHSTAREAATVAREAGAKRLALTHVSTRYAGDPSPLVDQAREVFDGELRLPDDGDHVEVPFPDDG